MCLFTRTQEEKKTRNVWGYPILDTIWEQQFYIPWLQMEKSLPFRAALYGPDVVDSSITKLLGGKDGKSSIYCIDFTSFDSSVSPTMSMAAFSYIASHFQRSYIDELRELSHRFINIPIFTPDGEVSGPHGVPSGSSFTNTVDSLVQWLISGHNGQKCQIQGDDGVYVIETRRVETLLNSFREAGLSVNESKSWHFKDRQAVYLQRYYSERYPNQYGSGLGGVYPIARALNRIKYLERWTDFEKHGIEGRDFFSLRTIMILENCKHHPCFRELVNYCQSIDKHGLKFSDEGVKAYSRMLEPRVRAGVLQLPQATKHTQHLSLIHI